MDVYNLMFQDEREAGMKNLSLSDLMENFVDAIQPADETKEANMEEAKKWLDEIQEQVAAPKTLEELITKLTTLRLFQTHFQLPIDQSTMVIVDHLNTYRESDIGKTTMLRHFLNLKLLDGSNYLEAVIQLIHELDSLCVNDPDEEEDVEVLNQFRLFKTLEKIDMKLVDQKKMDKLKKDIKNLIEKAPDNFVLKLTGLLRPFEKIVV